METIYEGYDFNEISKQFEPTDDTCVYCQTNKATSASANKYLTLYKEQDITNLLVFRSVKYNQFTVSIPRCASCYKIHRSLKLYSKIFTWSSFFLILPLGYYFIGGVAGMFASLISSFLIAIYVFTHSEKKFLQMKQIDSEGVGAERVKVVRDFLDDHWTGVAPSA